MCEREREREREREEKRRVWDKVMVLTESRTNLSFNDQVGHFLKVLDLIGINPNLKVV